MMRLSATEFFSCGFFCGDGQKFKNGRERERVQVRQCDGTKLCLKMKM